LVQPSINPKQKQRKKLKKKDTQVKKYPKRFSVVDTGSKGHIFLSFNDDKMSPTEFVYKILNDSELPIFGSRCTYSHKLIPVERVCKGEPSEIVENIQPLINAHFRAEDPKTFAIIYNSRNNNTIERQKCIESIGNLIGLPHKVNLSNPDLFVIVEIFKSACALSIVKDFYKLNKFNMRTIIQQRKGKGSDKK